MIDTRGHFVLFIVKKDILLKCNERAFLFFVCFFLNQLILNEHSSGDPVGLFVEFACMSVFVQYVYLRPYP